MAANSKSTREIATLGKRLANHIFKRDPSATARRFGHTSAYDKNVDEQARPSVVPDDVIEPQSEKYWEPNPQTGVFGPASGTEAAGTEGGFHSSPANGRDESVLEEKAWFRPTSLEDCEKPNHT
ncbi:hypothetical protein CISIN_1g033279mg [Citrus sinensis]|uniref:Late embryogenesis abundant protein n=1 Tax=Citrus sinensis TaxID=2711 RepID=A0A067DMB2_CITSI|nr:hypothetical protein CISIN_1g033279mg [Citrus sinensis]